MGRTVKKMNITYALIQGFYWSAYCMMSSFAAFFLKSAGYTNTELGVIVAGGSCLAFVLPLFVSPVIDRSDRLNASRAVFMIQVLELVLGSLVFIISRKCTVLSVTYVVWVGLMYMCNPLCTQIALDYSHGGQEINFGLARAFGSLAFVFASALIGKVLEHVSFRVLPVSALAMQAILALLILLLRSQSGKRNSGHSEEQREQSTDLKGFISHNPEFTVLLSGIAMVFIGSQFLGVYMINVVERVGGTATTMGYLHAFFAFMEIPSMVLWSRIGRGKWTSRLLMVSMICFTLKMVLFCLAGSVPVLFIGGIFQLLGYGMYTPAIVDYIRRSIPYEDSVKAQSLAGAMVTLGGVLASTVGGLLTDRIGVHTALVVFASVSGLGTLVCLYAIRKKQHKESRPVQYGAGTGES